MIFSYAFPPRRFSSKHPPFEVCLDREWSCEKRGPVAALPSDSSWRHMSAVRRSNLHNTPCKKQARHWGSGSVLDQDHGSAMLPHSHAFKSTPSLLRPDGNITCIRLRPLIQLALSSPSLRQFADPGLSLSLGRSTRPRYHIAGYKAIEIISTLYNPHCVTVASQPVGSSISARFLTQLEYAFFFHGSD